MNWHWNPHQSTFDLYDHNGDLTRENVEFGGSWIGDYPDKVEKVMLDIMEANMNVGHGNSPVMSSYSGKTLVALLQDDIEQGTPNN